LQRGSFFAFVEASVAREQHMVKYASCFFTRSLSWNHLAADYVRNEIKSSDEDIDRRPLLQVSVGVESTDVSHRLDDPPAIVCLKRGTEPQLAKKETPVEQRSSRPMFKKRKIVFGSGDLNGMLGG
jgi:hypothetical protein